MPHNWASAECIRYLRHMLVLEDDKKLRLLAGLMPSDLKDRTAFAIQGSPTRFGRVSLSAEPWGARGWKMDFSARKRRGAAEAVEIPGRLDPWRNPGSRRWGDKAQRNGRHLQCGSDSSCMDGFLGILDLLTLARLLG